MTQTLHYIAIAACWLGLALLGYAALVIVG